jgi:anti-sigma factor (TIGR02949 family)
MSEDEPSDEIEDIGCLEAINYFYAYLDGEITDPGEIAQFEHHLGHCRSCLSRIDFERTLSRRLREARDTDPPGQVQDRLRSIIDKF